MAGRLDGKVAVITGAAGGIGSAAARLFAMEGAHLVLGDQDEDALHALIAGLGGAAVGLAGDLSEEDAAAALLKFATDRHGRLDVLFNVVGISGRRLGDGPVDVCTHEGWERVLAVNLTSAFLCSKHAIPVMRRSGGGSIIHLSSVLGMVGHELFATHAYAASKGGLLALTKAMAVTYAADRIRCNALCPALVRTPMSARAQENDSIRAALPELMPLTGDFLEPEAVAAAALFLAGDESAAITGVALPVDAGWTAR